MNEEIDKNLNPPQPKKEEFKEQKPFKGPDFKQIKKRFLSKPLILGLAGLLIIIALAGSIIWGLSSFHKKPEKSNSSSASTQSSSQSSSSNSSSKDEEVAWDAKRQSDLNQLSYALKLYLGENGFYPKTDGNLAKISEICPVNLEKYINSCPKDPIEERYYGYISDGQSYTLSAALDDPECNSEEGTNSVYEYTYKITKEGNHCIYRIIK